MATFLPALSSNELLPQFTALETVMSDVLPAAVRVELPVVVQPVMAPTVPMVTASPLVRFTEPVLAATVAIRLPELFRV